MNHTRALSYHVRVIAPLLALCGFITGISVGMYIGQGDLREAQAASGKTGAQADRALTGWEKAQSDLNACLSREAELQSMLERREGVAR